MPYICPSKLEAVNSLEMPANRKLSCHRYSGKPEVVMLLPSRQTGNYHAHRYPDKPEVITLIVIPTNRKLSVSFESDLKDVSFPPAKIIFFTFSPQRTRFCLMRVENMRQGRGWKGNLP